jgi:hypothetical protein
MRKVDIKSILDNLENIDSSKFEYLNNTTKSKLICKYHGDFYRNIKQIRNGILCPKCNTKITSTEHFINKSKIIHNKLYNYKNTKYINSRTKLEIECHIHGNFKLFPVQHLRGQGCQLCKQEEFKNEFIEKAKKIHNYNYSKVIYKNNKQNVEVVCQNHGSFWVRPDNHINLLNGCPKCSLSNGELLISNFLNENNIEYEIQKTFDDCILKNKLRFDFYLPTYNICIEYNGIQHYESIKYFGGLKTLDYNNIRDSIKENYCINNNIKLIIIKYNENIIEKLRFFINN